MIHGYTLFEGFFETRDRFKLHYRFFKKEGSCNTLFLLHGHGEHSGRYVKFAEQLKQQNLSVAMYDMRGYGLSQGEACYVNRYSDYIDDFTDFLNFVRSKGDPLVKPLLLGHSNGGLVAVHWALQNVKNIGGLFLSSPFLGIKLPLPLILLNNFITWIQPHFVYSNPVYPPFLTHNPEELSRYKRDHLMRRKITARLLSEMMAAHRALTDKASFHFDFPIMILMAGLDRIVDPTATRAFYNKLRVPCKDLRVFEGFYHEIFNELGQDKVFEALREQFAIAKPHFAV